LSGLEHPELEDAIQKADILIEALTWIRRLRGKVTVIKLGGSVMEDPRSMTHLLLDIIFMETVGMRPVLVHGGGAAISRAMADAGLEPRFVQGRRYTDDATLAIVERVLAYEINEGLSRQIQEYGGKAQSLNFRTTNVLFGKRLALQDSDGRPVDLGHVGTVTRADGEIIRRLCEVGVVPVIPSMCLDEDNKGGKLNVNADTAATAVAQALGAEKMVYLSDVNGVRRDKRDPGSLIDSLTTQQAHELISSGVIDSGMIP
jgi:acetylglutamate kinase